jgi:hypothetical protein
VARCRNDPSYGEATEEGYYAKMATAFTQLMSMADIHEPIQLTASSGSSPHGSVDPAGLHFPGGDRQLDCANGVGAPQFKKLLAHLGPHLQVNMVNCGEGPLNEGVSACVC